MEFIKGEIIKFDVRGHFMTHYGTIIKVNKKSVTVKTSEPASLGLEIQRVPYDMIVKTIGFEKDREC